MIQLESEEARIVLHQPKKKTIEGSKQTNAMANKNSPYLVMYSITSLSLTYLPNPQRMLLVRILDAPKSLHR